MKGEKLEPKVLSRMKKVQKKEEEEIENEYKKII